VESPFKEFLSHLYECRQQANLLGQAMSFVYKTFMNALYGRFGINPQSTVTEIVDN
jgi:hypothetical protein